MLDLTRLEKLKRRGDALEARCPACAEIGRDRSGNHLWIGESGKYGCAAHPGDPDHRRRIYALAGDVRERRMDYPRRPILPNPAPVRNVTARLPGITAAADAVWREGVEYLRASESLVESLARWRGYRVETVRTLAEDGIMGCPITRGDRRGVAFAVEAPERCELGIPQTYRIGYHVRHRPPEGKRATWTFHPSARDAQATPALPFVIGAGFASSARLVVIVEGQWDAIALADAGGWLASDTAWPEDIILFGVRGVGSWRIMLDHWRPYLSPSAAVAVIAQTDAAAQAWNRPGNLVETLRRSGRTVWRVNIPPKEGKDVNDLLRAGILDRERVSRWIGKEVTP